MSKKSEAMLAALQDVYNQNPQGLLIPAEVVQAARDPASPLHDQFDWNVREAAEQWWLQQARGLITRFRVKLEGTEDRRPYPVFVSLVRDRLMEGGGYRPLTEVLESVSLTNELIEAALAEYHRLGEKYKMLKSLAGIRSAVAAVAAARTKKPKKKRK